MFSYLCVIKSYNLKFIHLVINCQLYMLFIGQENSLAPPQSVQVLSISLSFTTEQDDNPILMHVTKTWL